MQAQLHREAVLESIRREAWFANALANLHNFVASFMPFTHAPDALHEFPKSDIAYEDLVMCDDSWDTSVEDSWAPAPDLSRISANIEQFVGKTL